MALHFRFEMAFDVFGYLFHQAQINLLDLAAFLADEVMMMSRFNVMADEIAQLAVFVRGGQKNPATGKPLQYPVNRGKPNTLELLLQACLHLEWIKQAPAFEE